LLKSGLLGNKNSTSNNDIVDCASCKLGKSKTLPFPLHKTRTTKPFELLHIDVWGIAPVISHKHYRYFVTFIDDFTHFTWVYFLRSKSEVFSVFKALLALVETQFSAKIKILQSDSDGEYMSNEFQFFLQSHGIISQHSCPFTSQQNSVAERKNDHLLDVVRTLLIESCVLSHFWCEALSTVVYLITRLPSPNLNNDSPYFRLFGQAPYYSNLHIFGCVCFVHLPAHERNKLIAQSVKCAFLGYAGTQKGFLCYDPHACRTRVSRICWNPKSFFLKKLALLSQQQTSKFPSLSVLPHFSESPTPIQKFTLGYVYCKRTPLAYDPSTSLTEVPPHLIMF
jgi:hypothetical protein